MIVFGITAIDLVIACQTSSQSSIWTNDVFKNALGSGIGGALGGALAVVFFFLLRFALEKKLSRPQHLRTYSCAHDQNIGDANEYEGELLHHHGRRVTAEVELRQIDRTQPVWEWNRTRCGRDEGASVIYGPYTTDFPEPAEYEVVFSIRGMGLPPPQELQRDPVILRLDVTRKTSEYIPTERGIAHLDKITPVARHFVRASDLAQADWRSFSVRFYASGEGLWEYLVLAFDGASMTPDNLRPLGDNVRLFFDSVEIRRTKKMVVPWN